jgi:hypothetical protein
MASTRIEWNDSIEKSLDIMRQNVSKLSDLSNEQYLAFKRRAEFMNLPLAILSGANAGAIFFLEGYGFGHYVNIGCGAASLVIAGVLSYDWCSGTYKKMGAKLAFHRDCENLSNQIKTVLSMDRSERKMDGTKFLQQKFAEYKELVTGHSLIESVNGNIQLANDSIVEQVEDMQEYLYDHWNIIYRPTLRRFKKKNTELLNTVKSAGESVKTIIEPVVDTAEANCSWFNKKTNLLWKMVGSEKEEETKETENVELGDIYKNANNNTNNNNPATSSGLNMKNLNMNFVGKR